MSASSPLSRGWLAAPALAFVVLGAHFLRSSEWLGVILCVAALALLFVPARWAARAAQAALALGALEWAWTAFSLVQERLALGRPWLRMTLILAAVMVFTAASAWLVQRCAARERRRA
jgi:hypothetical protein